MQPEKTVRFANTACKIERLRYNNGRTAIVLTDNDTGEPIATATVNLVDQDLAPDEVAINHDCPKAGQALVEAGILEPSHRAVSGPWADWRIHRLVE